MATDFAHQLNERMVVALDAGGDQGAIAERLEASVASLSESALDFLFAQGLGGECAYGAFISEVDPLVDPQAVGRAEAAGYSIYDRLAPILSVMELEVRVERQPPEPIAPIPDLGEGPWGPLAVIEAPADGSDMARLAGTLLIGETCASMGGTTPVFRNSEVHWSPDSRSITFWDPIANVAVDLRHGDHVGFGGGELRLAAGNLTWLAEPDPSCAPEAFGVGLLGEVNGVRLTDLAP
ncbi:MAG: hypothetical protein ACRDGD_07705 [Candidatus Limnocylindria bacterium]